MEKIGSALEKIGSTLRKIGSTLEKIGSTGSNFLGQGLGPSAGCARKGGPAGPVGLWGWPCGAGPGEVSKNRLRGLCLPAPVSVAGPLSCLGQDLARLATDWSLAASWNIVHAGIN